MTSPIDGAIRRLILKDKRQGGVSVPRNRKAQTAEINIDPGAAAMTPFYKPEDGKGYTDPSGQSIYADEVNGEDVVFTQEILEGMQQQTEFLDYIAGLIEQPQNKSYIMTPQLPFDIEITSSGFFVVTGSCSVSFPSGVVTQGNPLVITVSSVSDPIEDLAVQINFKRFLVNA